MRRHIIETKVTGCMDCPEFRNMHYPRIENDNMAFYYYTKCNRTGKVLINSENAKIIGNSIYVNKEITDQLPEEYFLPDVAHNIFRKGKPSLFGAQFSERGSEVIIMNTIDIDCPLEEIEDGE